MLTTRSQPGEKNRISCAVWESRKGFIDQVTLHINDWKFEIIQIFSNGFLAIQWQWKKREPDFWKKSISMKKITWQFFGFLLTTM